MLMLTATTTWAWDGFGTEESPYQIKSTADLNQLAADVNGGNDYSGKYFVLTDDIEYTHNKAWNDATSTEDNFTAIGNNSKPFKGTFDGDGHIVSGIRIHKSGNDYQGLFSYIGSGA